AAHAFFLAAPAPPRLERSFAVGESPGIVALADLNGDGRLDAVTANEKSDDASILLSDGKGGFAPAPVPRVAAGHSPNDVAIAAFDGDGHPDLAFANHDSPYLTILLGDGEGGFRPSPHSPVSVSVKPHPHGLSAGDFNGDGRPDLVTDSWGDNRLLVLLNE